jgi:hypothetical protein
MAWWMPLALRSFSSTRLNFMLDFRRHRRASRYPGLGLEGRILTLLIGSALVVLLIVGAGAPRNWRWLLPEARQGGPQRRVGVVEPMAVATAKSKSDDSEKVDSKKVPDPFFPGVRSDYLEAVRDDSVFRPAESDAWFHLWALVVRTNGEELARASEGAASYLQLDQQPAAYRGRLVTISGVARAAKRVTAPKNAFDVAGYYQLWVQPDRGKSELIALYCHELPEGFPIGEAIEAECTATGFFFKRWAYQSRGGIATAPMIVARSLEWQPPPVAQRVPSAPLAEQLLTAIVAALLLALAVLAAVVWRGRAATKARADAATNQPDVGAALTSLASQPHDDPDRP